MNANDSAPGWVNRTPQTGQVISMPWVTTLGATGWPLGQMWVPSRDMISRSTLSTSLIVPTVLRTPGTGGRWRRASAAGRWSIRSASGRWAWLSRRRL